MQNTKIHKWNSADTVTSLRIAATFLLLLPRVGSPLFLIIYTAAGITDVLDGWLARRAGTADNFGARLDSIADLLFYGVLLLRLLPILRTFLPAPVWYLAAASVAVRISAYVTAAFKYRLFASLHTWLNKLCGAAVFLLPYVIAVSPSVPYCWGVCILALAASAEELAIHLSQREYSPDRKSLFR